MSAVNLKKNKSNWTVSYIDNGEVMHLDFRTIEKAADFMIDDLDVSDDAVDEALIYMIANDHNTAIISGENVLTEDR